MKITFLYNPQAGGSDLPVEDLVNGLKKRGAKVFTQCTKEDDYMEALEKTCDFMLIAGGDGTIKQIAKKIVYKNFPIAILPFGNANNIAYSLDVDTALDAIVNSWLAKDFRKFSVGAIHIDKESRYFLESVGWGLFAEVLNKIKSKKKKKKKKDPVDKKDKVQFGLSRLSKRLKELKPSFYTIYLDGVDYSGYYLWVEIMNTQSMGPQLELAPEASHGDEFLDVVMVTEDERESLEWFLNSQNGGKNPHQFSTIKAKTIKVKSLEPIHIDDEIHEPTPEKDWLEISLVSQYFWVING